MINNKLFYLVAFLFFLNTKAQDCNSLYIVNAQNGNVYNISALNGTLPAALTNLNAAARSNLAVGPNPVNLSQTVLTSSNTPADSPVYVANTSIGTNTPATIGGLTANPTTGITYGVSATRRLIKASPAPATDLGAITGDATWSGGTVSSDAFFDSTGRLYVIVTSGSARYLYRVDISTLAASQVIQLSGTLPSSFQGLAFYNGNIYAVQGDSATILFVSSFIARVYEINPNTGASILRTSYTLNTLLGPFSGADDLDLASCQVFIPSSAPTCNELFGINADQGFTYRINFDSSGNLISGAGATTQVASGTPSTHGNMAYGPVPSNLSQNQFVASPNGASGRVWLGVATSASTTYTQQSTATTWGSPIGIGTDPKTGFVYGINLRTLTRWNGSGAATTLGTITGDSNWENGTTLNDIAVDSGGNLYVISSRLSNTTVSLYRINPTALTATLVTQLTGNATNLPNLYASGSNGNGLAYLGDYFYYSRINNTNSTDLWRLNAMTGVSEYLGLISGTTAAGARRGFGDLGSCATVTNVPAAFTFDCNASGGGVQGAKLLANGTSQSSVLRVPISGAVNGLAEFTLTGTGISTSPSPYIASIEQGATFVDIPFTYNGSGATGVQTITIASPRAIGTCALSILIDIDSDGDGIANSDDQDDDNDGILDTAEGYCESQSIYTMNAVSSAANANASFGVNGNTFNLVYTLTSGPVVSGLGTSFNIPFTYSDFNNTSSSVNHTWEAAFGGTTGVGLLPNTTSLYTTPLPTENVTTETIPTTVPDISDAGFRYLLSTGNISPLGTFTSSIGNLPLVSGQLSSYQSNNLTFTSDHNNAFQTSPVNTRLWFSGYYARPVDLLTVETTSQSKTTNFPVNFGSSQNWLYTAFDEPTAGNAVNGGNRGLIRIRPNQIVYCNHRDTDGDGTPDYLDLDSDNDGCPDAREGAGNFNPTATASGTLATQTPNTNFGTAVDPATGIPTAVGAGQGVGQSNSVLKNDCLDSDGDTVPDWEDKDDDNDGILDAVECPTYTASPNIFVQSASGISSFNVDSRTITNNSFCAGNLNVTFDVAVNSAGVMYGVYTPVSGSGSVLAIINPSNCNVTTVISNIGFFANALSFLPDGTLLAGGGSTSKIYRINLSDNSVTEWYDYSTGSASGDFVFINGKVYVLWNNGTDREIRAITVNSAYNFVSTTTLGTVQSNAFGLAKANGNELYAVTGNTSTGGQGTILKINYQGTFSWNVIYTSSVSLLGATSIEESSRECDTDGDGIPNRLDLDSDGDGCPDAIEGGGAFNSADVVDSSMPGGNSGAGYTGTSTTPVIKNLPAPVDLVATSATYGVPTSAGAGQTVGDSQNVNVDQCNTGVCYKPGILDAGNTYPTKHGITALSRAGAEADNWPMLRQSAWTVLESKEKGFVVNRVSTTANLANITNPVEGMMVYDEEADCLKIYTLKSGDTSLNWHCFLTPACPD